MDDDPADCCECDSCDGFTGAMYTFAYAMRRAVEAIGDAFKPTLILFLDKVVGSDHG